jgi:hypothetical protein
MSIKNGILTVLALSLIASAVQTVKAVDTNVSTTTLSLGIPEVSLLKISAGVINLSLLQRNAGQSIETSKSDSTTRLLVTSVIRTTNRTLTAKITSGTVPTGTLLKLVAKQPNASFIGTASTLGAEVTLDATDRAVVTNIGTCYSGTAASDGYPLRFTYALDSNTATYSSLRANSGVTIIVTLTMTAAQ